MSEVPRPGQHADEVWHQPVRLAGSQALQERPRDTGDDKPRQVGYLSIIVCLIGLYNILFSLSNFNKVYVIT